MSPSARRGHKRRGRLTKAQRRAEYRRQAERITERRAELILLLAPELKCAGCGDQASSPAELIVDHVDGKSWTASRMSSSQRIARYYREHAAGISMRALCSRCSDTDGAYRSHGKSWIPPAADQVPF